MFNLRGHKLELDYPCHWVYKVIGKGQDRVRSAIAEVIQGQIYTITLSNTSRTGKYCCLNVGMQVRSEGHRTTIYAALVNHPDIKVVL
jgi:putative lipoic acid-binding regulatory protein